MTTEELGFLMKGQNFHRDQSDVVTSRSGSAPPNMEGSFAEVENLLALHCSSLNPNSGGLSNAPEDYESRKEWCFDPSCSAYHPAGANFNSKLPCYGGRNITSLDTSDIGSLHLSRCPLSTHKEEIPDDSSPRSASKGLVENSSTHMPEQTKAPLANLPKSLVDLIQEDFPRTPSPVYSQSHSSTHATQEESIDHDVHATSSSVSSINISYPLESITLTANGLETSYLNADAVGVKTSVPNSPCADGTESTRKNELDNKTLGMKHVALNSGTHQSIQSTAEHKIRVPNAETSRPRQQEQQLNERAILNHSCIQGTSHQVQPVQVHIASQGINNSESYWEKHPHRHAQYSSIGVQASLPSGLTSPLYASPVAFMNSGATFYPGSQPLELFSPQFRLGGYAISSTILSPYMTGYPSHATLPLPFEATSVSSLNGRTASLPSEEGFPNAGDLHHLNKFHGQHELTLKPSFIDPFHMQYYPHPLEEAHLAAFQYGQLASRTFPVYQVNSPHSQQDLAVAPYAGGDKFQPSLNGGVSIQNSRNVGISCSSYLGNYPSMGIMMQFPAPSPAGPIMSSSSVSETNSLGWKNETKISQGSHRKLGNYPGQRVVNSFNGHRKPPFLDEIKSTNSGKFALSDIAGHIVEISIDQHGSRFIQQKLVNCSAEEKASLFEEVLPHASKLMTDVFGNYVIQKSFKYGSPKQRVKLADQLSGQMLPLSLQMYGCRVIQKALEVIELDQKTKLVSELDGHVMRCVRDQNGNHVIQKCIEHVSMEKIGFIISAFRGQVTALSSHPYGCRVIQRVLEHCSDEQLIRGIVDEILESACVLAQDQYGNYVTQHVLQRGKLHERRQITCKLSGKILEMSRHKYASNVIEKCLEHGDAADRELLIEEIIGKSEENNYLLVMMKDQFANYVVQKILETSNKKLREILLSRIRVHLDALKKYTYGKHIVARFEQLSHEGSKNPGVEGE